MLIHFKIYVNTTDKCTALQWLEPEQTPNKKNPYMCKSNFQLIERKLSYDQVSQCQAIHARSIFPCQDTPDVKAQVYYCLRSPLQVIASGNYAGDSLLHSEPWEKSVGQSPGYKFEQRVPIPSYLIAIASGELKSADIGPRSTVWAGPDEIAACKWELDGDMEKFMEAAEDIVFKYAWGTYNVLVLPNSFPYGGICRSL
jgi:leukotriene-A4 hydrolase